MCVRAGEGAGPGCPCPPLADGALRGGFQVWHFGEADPDLGQWQAKELQDHLDGVLTNQPVEVISGQVGPLSLPVVLSDRPPGMSSCDEQPGRLEGGHHRRPGKSSGPRGLVIPFRHPTARRSIVAWGSKRFRNRSVILPEGNVAGACFSGPAPSARTRLLSRTPFSLQTNRGAPRDSSASTHGHHWNWWACRASWR